MGLSEGTVSRMREAVRKHRRQAEEDFMSLPMEVKVAQCLELAEDSLSTAVQKVQDAESLSEEDAAGVRGEVERSLSLAFESEFGDGSWDKRS